MPTPLIDSHCHLDDPSFDIDRHDVIQRAAESGITDIVIPAIRAGDFDRIANLARQHDIIRASAGLHPLFLDDHDQAAWEAVCDRAETDTLAAIGECGLDYTHRGRSRQTQLELFTQHVELAARTDLPLIIHANGAVEAVLQCVRRYSGVRGVIHSFNGSSEQAAAFLDLGFALGFGGAITYSRATRLRRLVAELPLDSIVLETDAPYQPGELRAGQRNQPAWITEVCDTVAHLQNKPADVVAKTTTKNARALFGID